MMKSVFLLKMQWHKLRNNGNSSGFFTEECRFHNSLLNPLRSKVLGMGKGYCQFLTEENTTNLDPQ